MRVSGKLRMEARKKNESLVLAMSALELTDREEEGGRDPRTGPSKWMCCHRFYR